ncbi:MAG TPA: hydrogenase maturation protease [Candidatus Binatus sp.]|nr:hydrogenase maturation protease [Candidatus Dormibacteraeota bacterium]HYL41474.1 hydrogenase maturation protease [Candidatus Binatus sp.]
MTLAAPTVRVLVCGSAERGDDGAALNAVAHVLPRLEPDLRQRVEVRRCVQLDASDLIDVADGEACLVLDTVIGVEPGSIVEISLDELTRMEAAAPRSSHALPIAQVLGITEAIRGQVPRGRLVGIGGKWFGYGSMRSRALRAGMAAFEQTIEGAIRDLAQPASMGARS